jgi:hypothetical protein
LELEDELLENYLFNNLMHKLKDLNIGNTRNQTMNYLDHELGTH